MRIPSLLLVLVGFSACPPPIIEETGEPGTDTDTDTDMDTDTDELVVSDQVVQLTSVVAIDRIAYDGPDRFVVVQEDLDGATGAILGSAPVTAGVTLDVEVELSEPLSSQRTQLFATLFDDSNNNGVFDVGTDLSVGSDNLVDGFQATVVAGTPDIRVVVVDGTGTAVMVTQVIPASQQAALVALGIESPAFNLARGLRYEFQNDSDVRLEFVNRGATPDDDALGLAQGDVVGLAEDQSEINWRDSDGFLRFTATSVLLLNVDGYRDGDDITEARGIITAQVSR